MPFELDTLRVRFVEDAFRKRSDFEWTEPFFLETIRSTSSKYVVASAVVGLRKVGTAVSIPTLKGLLSYPMSDVKASAVLTIAHIAGSAETEFYAEKLLDPKFREKAYAMWAIEDAADERGVPAVVLYLRKNMPAIRKNATNMMSHYRETILRGARYLIRSAPPSAEVSAVLRELAAISPGVAEVILPGAEGE